jgi:enamine deaminase RidA (YjgF/YER057c/UK114 family)
MNTKQFMMTITILFGTYLTQAQMIDYEKKLKDAKVELPAVTPSIGNYVKVARTGNLLYLSGTPPITADGKVITGKVGTALTLSQGYDAARLAAIGLLATLKQEIGDLNKVHRVVKVLGFVNCEQNFTDQPKVIDGCSDFLVQIFGEKGKHARSAVGTNSLPKGIAVEIELIVEICD